MEFVHAAKVEGLPKIVSIQNTTVCYLGVGLKVEIQNKALSDMHLLPLFTTFSAASNINFRIEDPVISLQLFYFTIYYLSP